MIWGSPLFRIVLALVSVTVSALLIGDGVFDLSSIGLRAKVQYRKALAELLAVQASSLAEQGETRAIEETIHALVSREQTVRSAAVRLADGRVLASDGAHEQAWAQAPADSSSLDYLRIPIFNGTQPWGTMEVAFHVPPPAGWTWAGVSEWTKVVGLVALVSGLGYWWFLKRALRQLDPSVVVPSRVRTALDVLTEGIVLLDLQGDIMLANQAFAERMGIEAAALLGRKLNQFPWVLDVRQPVAVFPWEEALTSRVPRISVPMRMRGPDGAERVLVCNCSPILDDRQGARGVLVSFDDVTELESANHRLLAALDELRASKQEVVKQNEALHTLATRDPLTGCLNRRAFFDQVGQVMTAVVPDGVRVGCLMMDIDHFKSFNDRYGHAVGDQVLVAVAQTIRASIRTDDLCARYGGEEFCVIVTNVSLDVVLQTAERLRRNIEMDSGPSVPAPSGLHITTSVGVAYTTGPTDIQALLAQADQALYHAKQQGRNRVAQFDAARQQPVDVGSVRHAA